MLQVSRNYYSLFKVKSSQRRDRDSRDAPSTESASLCSDAVNDGNNPLSNVTSWVFLKNIF